MCEPAANTPFPAYYGLQAIGAFATPGAEMVSTSTSNDTVTSYAVKTSTGMNLMLVNHSAQSSEPVSINYSGFNAVSVTSAEQFSRRTRSWSRSAASTRRPDPACLLPSWS